MELQSRDLGERVGTEGEVGDVLLQTDVGSAGTGGTGGRPDTAPTGTRGAEVVCVIRVRTDVASDLEFERGGIRRPDADVACIINSHLFRHVGARRPSGKLQVSSRIACCTIFFTSANRCEV